VAGKIRDLNADLRKAGFTWRRAKGDHRYWEHPDVPAAKLSLDGRDGDDAKPYQVKEVRNVIVLAEHARKGKP